MKRSIAARLLVLLLTLSILIPTACADDPAEPIVAMTEQTSETAVAQESVLTEPAAVDISEVVAIESDSVEATDSVAVPDEAVSLDAVESQVESEPLSTEDVLQPEAPILSDADDASTEVAPEAKDTSTESTDEATESTDATPASADGNASESMQEGASDEIRLADANSANSNVGQRSLNLTFRVKSTTTWGLNIRSVHSSASSNTIVDTLWYPATINVTTITTQKVDGYYWLYGRTSNGKYGWLVYNLDWIEVYPIDTSKPTISNIRVYNVTSSGYAISCTVSDSSTIYRVAFPTWTSANGQDDLIWHEGLVNGNSAACYISISNHKNQKGCQYITHVYAWDFAGNQNSAAPNGNGQVWVPSDVMPSSVSLGISGTTLYTGDTRQITARVYPTNAVNSGLTWKSSKPSVASVFYSNGNMYVSARKKGKTVITVRTSNGKTAKIKITVKKRPKAKKITLSPSGSLTMTLGSTRQLGYSIKPAAAWTTVSFKSSNPGIVSVNGSGLLTANRVGTVTITATTKNKKKAKLKVTVKGVPITGYWNTTTVYGGGQNVYDRYPGIDIFAHTPTSTLMSSTTTMGTWISASSGTRRYRVVNCSCVDVKSEPNTSSSTLHQYKKGDTIATAARWGNWYVCLTYIMKNNNYIVGWVHKDYLSFVEVN